MTVSVVSAMSTKSGNRTPLEPLNDNHKNICQPSCTCAAHGDHNRYDNDNNHNDNVPQPPCLTSPPPLTDSNEISELWARVRSNTQQEQMPQQITKLQSVLTTEAKKKTAVKGTAKYSIQELESRHITIVQDSTRPVTSVLPDAPTASQAELEGLYVPVEDDDYIDTVMTWAESSSHVHSPALPEYQWASDVYLRFLRARNKPRGVGKDTIKVERNLQPWVSLKWNGYILLPPKEASPATPANDSSIQTRSKTSKRKRVSVLPDEILVDNGEKEFGSISKGQQTAMRPDIMYASHIGLVDNAVMYETYPAIRTFTGIDRLPPYIIGEFKSTVGQAVEAQQSLALLGAMMLLERVKLRRLSPNLAIDDIKLFMLTCCGPRVEIYCMVIRTTGDHCLAGELLSYDMNQCSRYILKYESDIKRLGEDLNRIHLYGQTTHLDTIRRDLAAVTRHNSLLADLDKRSYQYNGLNEFDQGDELVIGQDQESSMTPANDPSSSAALSVR